MEAALSGVQRTPAIPTAAPWVSINTIRVLAMWNRAGLWETSRPVEV